MLRVYLDQNKWVDLARAAAGRPDGERFADALAVCRAARDLGTASFPLDMYRYWETSKRRDDRSRHRVADLMRELSLHHTMAVPIGLLDHELDVALRRRFGRPERPRSRQVFGVGIRHIGEDRLSWPEPDFSALPDGGASVPAGLRAQVARAVVGTIEAELLRAGPETLRAVGLDPATSDHDKRFVEHEQRVAAEIARHGLTGDAVDMAVRASDFGDITPAVIDALGRIGIEYDEFVAAMTPAALMAFMDDLPTRHVTNVLRSAKHRQHQQKWEPNDFVDIVALPVAAVHCDVVVTERQWVHRMKQGRVDQRYSTVLLSDTADLVSVLAHDSSDRA